MEAIEHYDFREKLSRAIGRTALVNAIILGGGPGAGFAAGGALTAGRIYEGNVNQDKKEQMKAGVVYATATTASCIGQIVGGLVGMVVAGPPGLLIGAFGTGCASGILAGAASEVIVDATVEDKAKEEDLGTELGELIKADVQENDNIKVPARFSVARRDSPQCTSKFRRPNTYWSI